MKIFNIFKKETKKVAQSKTSKLDKTQLEKVVGGADLTSDGGVNTGAHKRPGSA